MDEVEVKILDIDKKKIIAKLKKLGAKKVFEGRINAIIFDTKDDKIWKSGNLLRVRKVGKKAEVVLKEKVEKTDIKHYIEHEITIDNFETALNIFEKLGYMQKDRLEKNRISYSLGKLHFDIDSYPGIPTFMEVEAHSRKELEKGVKLLGYQMKDTKAWSAWDVAKHYKKDLNKLKFKR
jgi:adenylate cyclase, class 2